MLSIKSGPRGVELGSASVSSSHNTEESRKLSKAQLKSSSLPSSDLDRIPSHSLESAGKAGTSAFPQSHSAFVVLENPGHGGEHLGHVNVNGSSQNGCPPHGAKAVCGRRPRMEDAYHINPYLLEITVPGNNKPLQELFPPRIATQLKSASASTSPSSSDSLENHPEVDLEAEQAASQPEAPSCTEALHFFGVFDGHGGAEAALHCAKTLHQRIVEALSAVTTPSAADEKLAAPFEPEANGGVSDPSSLSKSSSGRLGVVAEITALPEVAIADPLLPGAPEGVPGEFEDDSSSGSESSLLDVSLEDVEQPQPNILEGEEIALPCSAERFQSALTNAFCRTDEEFGKADNAALVGTTAVVALVGRRQLYVANCGKAQNHSHTQVEIHSTASFSSNSAVPELGLFFGILDCEEWV